MKQPGIMTVVSSVETGWIRYDMKVDDDNYEQDLCMRDGSIDALSTRIIPRSTKHMYNRERVRIRFVTQGLAPLTAQDTK